MIRKAELNDIPFIVSLEEANLISGSLGNKFFETEMTSNPFSVIKVLEIENEIIGYISLRVVDKTAEVLNLVIDKKYQKQGYGYKLLMHILGELRNNSVESLILEVRASNIAAQYLYYKCGFKRILQRPNYYLNEDGYVFLWENKS